jgi:hypothetical protein
VQALVRALASGWAPVSAPVSEQEWASEPVWAQASEPVWAQASELVWAQASVPV